MRWARERYQSYRGQRESIRKESAQRFGQGVSAIQDKIYSAPLSLARMIKKRGEEKQSGAQQLSEQAKEARVKAEKFKTHGMHDAAHRQWTKAKNLETQATNISSEGDRTEKLGRGIERFGETFGFTRRAGARVRDYEKTVKGRLGKEYNAEGMDLKKREEVLAGDYDSRLKATVYQHHIQEGKNLFDASGKDYNLPVKQWTLSVQKWLHQHLPEEALQLHEKLLKLSPELAFLDDSLKIDKQKLLLAIGRGDVKKDGLAASTYDNKDIIKGITEEMTTSQFKDFSKRLTKVQKESFKGGMKNLTDSIITSQKAGTVRLSDEKERTAFRQFAIMSGDLSYISSRLEAKGLGALRNEEFKTFFRESTANDLEKINPQSVRNPVVMKIFMDNVDPKKLQQLGNTDIESSVMQELKIKVKDMASTDPTYTDHQEVVENSREWQYA